MAKESGLGVTTCAVDDSGGTARNLVNDVVSVDISLTRAVDDITGLDVSAMERLLLLGDASATLNTKFNDAANQAHAALSTVCTSDAARTFTFAISGQTFTMESVLTNYNLSRPNSGALNATAGLVLADGADPTWA